MSFGWKKSTAAKRTPFAGTPPATGCEVCRCRWVALDPHHLLPVSAGGAEQDPANVMWLCPNHHRLVHTLWRVTGGRWPGPVTREALRTALLKAIAATITSD